jgi:hypothetical protein
MVATAHVTLLALTHLIAVGLGLLASLSYRKPQQIETIREEIVADKFVSLLDHIGEGLKKFFTSPVAADVEGAGITIAEAAWPGLTPLLSGIQASLAKAQALAAAANVTGDTTAQVTALTLADAQQVFATYQQTSGTKLETAQQNAIISLLIQMLQNLPAPPSNARAPAAPAAAVPAAPVVQIQPGGAVAAVAQNGPGLASVVPQ